jgi:phage shock protein E
LQINKYFMAKLLEYKWVFAGIALGTLAGYLYWKYVGCLSGTCAITSSPIHSSLYGAMMGGLLLSSFSKEKPKTTIGTSEENTGNKR